MLRESVVVSSCLGVDPMSSRPRKSSSEDADSCSREFGLEPEGSLFRSVMWLKDKMVALKRRWRVPVPIGTWIVRILGETLKIEELDQSLIHKRWD